MPDNKPVAQVRLYPFTAAIWTNATAKGSAFYSVTFSRFHVSFHVINRSRKRNRSQSGRADPRTIHTAAYALHPCP
jgi:hypothetical protein